MDSGLQLEAKRRRTSPWSHGIFHLGSLFYSRFILSVMQLQANIDMNTKETGKIQIHVWSLHLPHFWCPDRGTTITSAVHRWSGASAMSSSSFFPLSLMFIQSKPDWKIWLLLWKQCMSSYFLTNFFPWFMVMERSLKTFWKTSSLVFPSILLEGLGWKN